MTRYIGKQPAFGNFVKLDAISVVNGQSAYTMQSGSSNFTNYDNVNQFIVSLNGLIQNPGTSFSVSGSTITFASGLSTGDVINFILVLGDVLSVGTPSDNTVSTAKIQNTAVNADKLATDAVQTAKIQNDAVTKDKVNFISDSTAGVEVKGDGGSNDGYIQLNCRVNSHGIKLKSPPHSAGQSYTLTFPSTAPATDKILQTDGSGNLSFVDAPSGGLAFISRQSVSSGVSYVSFNQVMTTTYHQYIIFIEGIQPNANGTNLRMQFQTSDESSGAYDTGSNYNFQTMRNNDGNGAGSTGQTYIQISRDGGGDNDAQRIFNMQLNISNASSTTQHKMVYGMGGGRQHDGTFSGQLMFGTYEDTARLTGFRLFYDTGVFEAQGFVSLYGIVTS